ncbi:MAG: amidase [Qingshengfaniella sp.]
MRHDWRQMGAVALGREIAAGRVDPLTLAETFLEAIDNSNQPIYARTTPRRALAEARAAADRARDGLRCGPLDGVPLSWKDLFDTAGCATEAGSRLLKGRVPGADAEVLRRATLGGSVCLGKTHMSELAFSGLGLNPVTATPPNIHRADLAPGGSSSGAAASVAFGLAAAAVASDTGGSVRVPAAWNDLVGFKPAHGALPLTGVVPLCESFDTIGPIARSVADAAAVHALLGGAAVDLRGAEDLHGRHLGVLTTVVTDDLDPQVAEAFEGAVQRLSEAGAQIVEFDAPEVIHALDLAPILFATEAYATWMDEIEDRPELMYDRVLDRFRGGAGYGGTDFIRAWQGLRRLRAEWTHRIAALDAVILPTTAILPPPLAQLRAEPDFYDARNLMALRNTRIANLMAGCALTLPTGQASCGVSLVMAGGCEGALLRLGAAVESVLC